MPIVATVEMDTAAVERMIRALGQKAPLAISRALNRTIQSAQGEATKAIASDMKIIQREVRRSLAITRARPGRLQAQLTATGRRIPLIAFRARGPEPSRGKGLGVTYDLGRGRGHLPHTFIARMRSGHRGVYRRKAGAGRTPILELKGPSVPRVFTRDAILRALKAKAETTLTKNLKYQVDYLMTRSEAAPE